MSAFPRGRGWNWRAHLNRREAALIERAEILIADAARIERDLDATNWKAIVDRAVERARSRGDRA